jgi:acetylornithine deacetylase
VSAFESFLPIFRALDALEAERNGSIDHPLYQDIENKIPINIGVARSGSWPSSVPDWLFAEGRAGLVPGETLEQVEAELIAANKQRFICGHLAM